jgi:hypothetical protein
MRVRIDRGERFPDYGFESLAEGEVGAEVDESTLDRWQKAIDAYNEAQCEMRDAWAATKAAW